MTLVAVGIWTCSRLLLSSQAVGILLIGAVWTADVASRLLTGAHLIGGTEYMWDPQWPLPTRLMSLYHVILPPLLVLTLRRIGYDPRGYWLQSAIAVAGVSIGRLFPAASNINDAHFDPILKRTWGGPLTHIAVVAGCGLWRGKGGGDGLTRLRGASCARPSPARRRLWPVPLRHRGTIGEGPVDEHPAGSSTSSQIRPA